MYHLIYKPFADNRSETRRDSTRIFKKILGCSRGERFKSIFFTLGVSRTEAKVGTATSAIVQKRESVLLPWSRVSRVYFEHAHSALSFYPSRASFNCRVRSSYLLWTLTLDFLGSLSL